MDRLRFATAWLGGCSGCHMSFLDLDEWLIDFGGRVEVVYSPLVDAKTYPTEVDVCLIEGAVANEEHLARLSRIRQRTRVLVSFGDCAITGNVTALRNPLGQARAVLERAYLDEACLHASLPRANGIVPKLLDRVMPIHEVTPVEQFLPGCPPSAGRIRRLLEGILRMQTG